MMRPSQGSRATSWVPQLTFNDLGKLSTMPEIPKPDYNDPKEVFAFFGLAYYQAAVLEHGVLNLAVAMLAKRVPGITAGDVERLYESFAKSTFGQVINAAKAKFDIPSGLEADLALVLERRNYLAHRFFVVHDIDFMKPSGRRKMIDELIQILEHFQSVDMRMDEIWIRAWESFGITKEWIEQKTREFISERYACDQ